MKAHLGRGICLAVLATACVLVSAAPAVGSPARPALTTAQVRNDGAAPSTLAAVRIVISKTSGLAVWRPHKVSGPSLSDGSTCDASDAAFVIKNRTAAHQQVDIVGSGESLQVDADSNLDVCGFAEPTSYVYKFKIQGGKGTLTATFVPAA